MFKNARDLVRFLTVAETGNVRAAEAAVEEWRSAGTLPLPEFSEPMIAKVDDTLEFPVKGAVRPEPVAMA